MIRTEIEMENDYKRLEEAAKTAKSIKELGEHTGLSYAKINTTLNKYQNTSIREQLAINKQKANVEAQKNVILNKNNNVSVFVIDASIAGIENFREYLSKIDSPQSKVVLTSITVKELEEMQGLKNIDGKDARYLLDLAAQNYQNSFETVLIDETLDTPDDCVIKYCADHNESVILLTSNKTMALKARMYSVQVRYLKKTKNISHTDAKIRTLVPAKRIEGKLCISNFQTNTMSIRVYSNGIEYNDGIRELHVGDDVLIASKKPDYITFAHYRMVSLFTKRNCELIYSRRFYNYNDIDVTRAMYKTFLKDFKTIHNV